MSFILLFSLVNQVRVTQEGWPSSGRHGRFDYVAFENASQGLHQKNFDKRTQMHVHEIFIYN